MNLKEEFIEWIYKNSKPNLSAVSRNTISKNIDESNDFFVRDIMDVDQTNYEEMVEFLKDELYKTNTAFQEYNASVASGRPRAILGKENYLRFLEEKFGSKNIKDVNYWIFQCNPNIYDLKNALRNDAVKMWTVAAHKEKIKPGDKVIIWQTGNEAGCLALGEVLTEPAYIEEMEEEKEFYYGKDQSSGGMRVKMDILHDFTEEPVLWQEIKGLPEFKNFKAGNQGTNFSATEEEYKKIKSMAKKNSEKQYWLYSPGKQGKHWEEFYREGIMAIGWDRLGDLEKYSTKEEVIEKLQEFDNSDSSKKNDATACDDFQNKMKIGDVIIVKKGKRALLGHGVVTSDYFYDPQRSYFQKCRNVDWKQKGIWHTEFDIVTKTLTDITPYKTEDPNYKTYYERLLGIMSGDKSAARTGYRENLNQILYGPPGTGKTYYSKELAVRIANPDFSFRETLEAARRQEINEEYQRLYNQGQIIFTTFHQSFSYEDFVEGIKPLPPEGEGGSIAYAVQDGIFKNLCTSAKTPDQQSFDSAYESLIRDLGTSDQIQEIKTPTGKIFGISLNSQNNLNLHTGENMKKQGTLTKGNLLKELIGEDRYPYWQGYFQGVLEHLKNGYQFQNSKHVIPKNYVLIIDEINRGNISSIFGELITLLEADKRIGNEEQIKLELPYSKISFGVPNNLFLIGTMNTADRSVEALDTALRRRFTFKEIMPAPYLLGDITFLRFNLEEVLETINNRIEALLDRDHTIGHSYFIKIVSGDTAALKEAFQNKIIPLLQEYFYHDYEKIALILGEGFIERKEEKVQFASFNQIDDPEILPSFELKKDIEDIEAAVRNLLNRKDEEAA